MKHPLLTTVSALLPVLPLAAQTQTSPAGVLNREGIYSTPAFGAESGTSGRYTYLRQLDGTLAGTGAKSITSLKLRRDGAGATNTTATARTLSISARLAHGDYTKIKNSTQQPDTDWLSGSWSAVATAKTISLPDLRTQPATTPAPWAITIPFDAPFSFSGTKALAIDLKLGGSSLPSNISYWVDAEMGMSYAYTSSSTLGVGCTPIGGNAATYHTTIAQNYGDAAVNGYVNFGTIRTPINSAAWLLIGASNPALDLGLCTKLMSSAEVATPMPATSAAGATSLSFNFSLTPQMAGGNLFSQVVVADAGQPGLPYLLSNGAQTTLPAAPIFTIACATMVAWSVGVDWQNNGRWYKNGGIVFGF